MHNAFFSIFFWSTHFSFIEHDACRGQCFFLASHFIIEVAVCTLYSQLETANILKDLESSFFSILVSSFHHPKLSY